MIPSAVTEQQSKLGVSAEESKAQRLKRQQSRFRDRGGAYVPSNANPLVDILLSRTVSGESPSKARPKVIAKHPTPHKSRQKNGAAPQNSQAAAGGFTSKAQGPRKQKAHIIEREVHPITNPPPKRRGRPPKVQNQVPEPKQPLSDIKIKPTSKGKGKPRNTTPITSDGKSKPKGKVKQYLPKTVEVLASDDDRTLVEVPHKTKTESKGKALNENDGDTDDDMPLVGSQALHSAGKSQASGITTVADVKTVGEGSLRKRAGNGPASIQAQRTNAKKRLVPRDEDPETEVATPAPKKGKTSKSTAARTNYVTEPELEPPPRATKDTKNSEHSKTGGKGRSRNKVESDPTVVKPVVGDDKLRPVPRPKKRKKEESYDNRPRKVVKFSDASLPHTSSQKLRENQSDIKHKSVAKASIQDESDVSRPRFTIKPPPCSMAQKGPPPEVLKRIMASAARYSNPADGEPDELDCLS